MSNATFSNLTVSNNGTTVNSPAGIDINLKNGSYTGIVIDGFTFTDVGGATSLSNGDHGAGSETP